MAVARAWGLLGQSPGTEEKLPRGDWIQGPHAGLLTTRPLRQPGRGHVVFVAYLEDGAQGSAGWEWGV